MLVAVPKGVPVARDGSGKEVVVSDRDGHDGRWKVSDAVSESSVELVDTHNKQ